MLFTCQKMCLIIVDKKQFITFSEEKREQALTAMFAFSKLNAYCNKS